MAIVINTNELYELLDITPASENIMLSGRHGIGKSQILTNYFTQKGLKVVPLFLGQMSDPGDLIGLPDRDAQEGQTRFLPPYWFPKDNQPVVLFLDELNRARPEVLQAIMDLALNRTIAGRSLPEGSRVISAVNEGDEYQLTDLDPALVSRFNVYRFQPSVNEWLLWAAKKGINQKVIDFISEHPQELDAASDAVTDGSLEKSADRRGWERVSLIISSMHTPTALYQKAVAGIVGAKAASRFWLYISDNNIISAQEILANFSKVKKTLSTYDVPKLAVVNDSIFRFLETETPPENAGDNLQLYVDFLKPQKEAMAQFAANFTDMTYPKALGWIGKYSPKIIADCISFVKDL